MFQNLIVKAKGTPHGSQNLGGAMKGELTKVTCAYVKLIIPLIEVVSSASFFSCPNFGFIWVNAALD